MTGISLRAGRVERTRLPGPGDGAVAKRQRTLPSAESCAVAITAANDSPARSPRQPSLMLTWQFYATSAPFNH